MEALVRDIDSNAKVVGKTLSAGLYPLLHQFRVKQQQADGKGLTLNDKQNLLVSVVWD